MAFHIRVVNCIDFTFHCEKKADKQSPSIVCSNHILVNNFVIILVVQQIREIPNEA